MPAASRSERVLRVVFYDHDYTDSDKEAHLGSEPTVLSVIGRLVDETDLFLVLSTCDRVQGEATRFAGAPMTVFRVLRSAIVSTEELRAKTTRRKKA